MNKLYILQDKVTIPCHDLIKWADWFGSADRVVAKELIGDVSVSTVFLGLDHNLEGGIKIDPILFETMIFGGEYDGYQEQYSTWEEALAGHEKAVRKVKGEPSHD